MKPNKELAIICGPRGTLKKWIILLNKIIDYTAIESKPEYLNLLYNAPPDEFYLRLTHAVKTLLKVSPYLAELEDYLASYGDCVGNLDVAIVPEIVLRRYDWNMHYGSDNDIYSLRIAVANVSGLFKNYPKLRQIHSELDRLWLEFGNTLIEEMNISRLWIYQYRLLCKKQRGGFL